MNNLIDNSIFIGSKNKTTDYLKQNYPGFQIITVDKVENQIKSYSRFFDSNKIFLVMNPTNDEIKLIGNTNNCQYSLFFDDDSFDGRLGFISKIKKSGKIFDFSYPLLGDTQVLRRKLNDFSKSYDFKFTQDAIDWIISNCPTLSIKVKSDSGKKEKLVYDIDLLSQEIAKLSSVKKELCADDFADSVFNNEESIFTFIDKILQKDYSCFEKLDELVNKIGEQALLLITLSQILYLLSFVGGKQRYGYDVNKIHFHICLKDIINKYLGDDWNELQTDFKHSDIIRLQIQMNKQTPSEVDLSKMIVFIVETIKDLRNSGSKDQALFILLNKLISV